MLLRVDDLRLAVHLPFPQRRDDLQLGRQRLHGDVETDLVVAFAGAAVRNSRRTFISRDCHHLAGDQRAGERRCQRIVALVACAGKEGRKGEVADERLLGVLPDVARGARRHRERLKLLARPVHPHIDGQSDNVVAALFLEPADGDRGVEAAGVGEDDLLRHRATA